MHSTFTDWGTGGGRGVLFGKVSISSLVQGTGLMFPILVQGTVSVFKFGMNEAWFKHSVFSCAEYMS